MTAARGVRSRNVRSSRPLLLPRFSRRSASRPFAHFGIISVVAVEMGLLTPPFGLSVFAVRSALGVNDVRLETIFAGALPYVGIMLAVLVLLIAFPALSTWLAY